MKDLSSNLKKRRKEFIAQIPENSVVIIPNSLISIRSNDVEYKFRPDSDFYYLTGFEEPNSICVLKKEKRSFFYLLFIEENSKEKEIWTGKKVGISEAKRIYKADEAYLIMQFDDILKKIVQEAEYIYFPFGKNKLLDLKITNLQPSFSGLLDPRKFLHEMRLIKDNYEIQCIKKAADISSEAHVLAMECARSGIFEYELESIMENKFRSSGGTGPAYPSIVASGRNCTTLHYIKNNKKIQKQDLVLIDAGCEYSNYASDLTRTFPENKRFNSIQRDIYQIVLAAQIKAIEQIKPGKRFIDSYNKAVYVLVEGLKDLGLLKGSIQEIIKKGKYKKFFMHKLGHWLGLDVHDAGPYMNGNGNSIKLVPGMIMTVEPGIYISWNEPNVPEKFRGIGIRIEDDVLITKNGNQVLTNKVPKTIEEIEAFSLSY